MTAPHSSTPSPPHAPAEDFRTPALESSPPPDTNRLHRLWRGRTEDPAWARPALFALLAVSAVLYLWDLSASGWANDFYSAAAQAGSQSWKAMLFGSSDAANSITVDKPPAGLWPMDVSVRLFGLGSWQILAPEALMGVASVGLLYATVKRRFGPAAGLIAGGTLMVTPVAALMFRYDNPDAMLELLMLVAIYFALRALEDGRTKWLLWTGATFGLAFLTKALAGWMILPAVAIVYAVCGPPALRKRLVQLLYGALALLAAGGWWVLIVQLWPASSRPYIGGSQDNNFLSLTFGYNGFGRITGDETGSVGGGGGATGLSRLFTFLMGGQISWLLPAAFVGLAVGVYMTWKAKRTDTERSAFLVWGGALLFTFVTFSFMSGIFQPYYNIALAPYIAALVGMGTVLLWRRRTHIAAAGTLAIAVMGTSIWAAVLLNRTPSWDSWLKVLVVVFGLISAAGLLAGAVPSLGLGGRPLTARPDVSPGADGEPRIDPATGRPYADDPTDVIQHSPHGTAPATPASRALLASRIGVVSAVVGLVAVLGGPIGYTLDTVNTPHTGSGNTAGPKGGAEPGGLTSAGTGAGASAGQSGGFGGGAGAVPGGGGFGGGAGAAPGGGGFGGGAGAAPGGGGFGGGAGAAPGGGAGAAPGGTGAVPGGAGAAPGGPGASGLLTGVTVSSGMESLLKQDADQYTWVAATVGSQKQGSYQLATGDPVMAVGGFSGTDPSPTLGQFQQDVSQGEIHYYIAGSAVGSTGTTSDTPQTTASQIDSWVKSHYTAQTVDGVTVYDLTAPTTSTTS